MDFIPSDRSPCIVCGHPTGDCVGEDTGPAVIAFFEWAKDPDKVLVTEDIYEERQITPRRTTRVLTARAGQYIPRKRAEDLGIA